MFGPSSLPTTGKRIGGENQRAVGGVLFAEGVVRRQQAIVGGLPLETVLREDRVRRFGIEPDGVNAPAHRDRSHGEGQRVQLFTNARERSF